MDFDAIRTNNPLRFGLLTVGLIGLAAAIFCFDRLSKVEAQWVPVAAVYWSSKVLYDANIAELDPLQRKVLEETIRQDNPPIGPFLAAFASTRDEATGFKLLQLGLALKASGRKLEPLDKERNLYRTLAWSTLVVGIVGVFTFVIFTYLGRREKPPEADSLFPTAKP